MRIALDARYLNATASALGQYCENLIEHLAQVDTENEYVAFIHHSYPKTLRLGDNFTVKPMRAGPLTWRTFLRFHRQIERAKVDALHSMYPIVPLFYDGPLMATVHDLKPLMAGETDPEGSLLQRGLREGGARSIYPTAIRRAKWLAAVSEYTRAGLVELFPEAYHKTVVVHSGLEPSFLTPLDDSTVDLVCAKYKPPARYIYYSGSLRPSKNIDIVLAALSHLRANDDFGDLQLILDAPPGRWMEATRKTARRMGLAEAVLFYGSVNLSERRVLHARAAAFCFPCKNEGFGFPVLEAQASGVPVVAADSGALPEVAGGGALLVTPDHVPSLVAGLRQALNDEALREELIRAGRENSRKYLWRKTAERMRDMYQYLL